MFKKILSSAIFMVTGIVVFAQTEPAATERVKLSPPDFMMSPYFWLIGFVLVILVATIIIMGRALSRISKNMLPKPEVKIEEAPDEFRETIFGKLINKMSGSVPIAQEEDILMHHDYDGIRELDNNLPPWWKWGFVFTIIFGFFYLLHYHVFRTGKLSLEEYTSEMQIADEQRKLLALTGINAENVTALVDASDIDAGKQMFVTNCTPCHGPGGGGVVGPNLTDDFWIHGGGVKNIFNTITEGVPTKMIAWKTTFSPKQRQQLASFVLSIHGTNPVGGKEPQGNKWEEAGVATDSSATLAPVDSTVASGK